MEYSIRLHARVISQIRQWGLTDSMLVDVYLRLRQDLPIDPMAHLNRDLPGSLFVFELRNPADPHFQHIFMFRIFFDEDEKHLNIVRGSYWRNFDPC